MHLCGAAAVYDHGVADANAVIELRYVSGSIADGESGVNNPLLDAIADSQDKHDVGT